jgi:DNA-binding NarL/FixJ family response regulator
MLAITIGTDVERQHLERLRDIERLLIETLVDARESLARCEQALLQLAETRSMIADLPEPPRCTALHRPTPLLLWNRRSDKGAPVTDTLPGSLTTREIEVLRLIASGQSNRQIADALFLSPRTIERHIANIYLKIDAHNKAEATRFALQHRLV